MKKRVVLDLDVGTDDAFALLLLLHAEKLGLVKIEAIVCTMGNASLEDVTRNVVRILEIVNRTDIPIYKGAANPIVSSEMPTPRFHGKDGLGDLAHSSDPNLNIVQKEPACTAIRNLVINNPGEVTLLCIGPLTNAALSMKIFEDFALNIKEIFILGGNYTGRGNATETAEFNFHTDPEAAYVVLENARCPVTIATWETCLNTHIEIEWRFDVLGSRKTPFIELLNRAERNVYSKSLPDSPWFPCDSLIVVAMLYPEQAVVRSSTHHATVELYGSKTRGQVVLDHLKKKTPNITVIEELDQEVIKKALIEAVESIV